MIFSQSHLQQAKLCPPLGGSHVVTATGFLTREMNGCSIPSRAGVHCKDWQTLKAEGVYIMIIGLTWLDTIRRNNNHDTNFTNWMKSGLAQLSETFHQCSGNSSSKVCMRGCIQQ
jgi:hypothetical protein